MQGVRTRVFTLMFGVVCVHANAHVLTRVLCVDGRLGGPLMLHSGPSWRPPPAQIASPCPPSKAQPVLIAPAGRLQAKVRGRGPPPSGFQPGCGQPWFTSLGGLGCCVGKWVEAVGGAAPGTRTEAEVPGRCHPRGTWGWCGTLHPCNLRQSWAMTNPSEKLAGRALLTHGARQRSA